jgi:hypothetical protein
MRHRSPRWDAAGEIALIKIAILEIYEQLEK